MSGPDKRKNKRRPLHHAGAIIVDGKVVASCQVRDISVGGARLCFEGDLELPDEFELVLTGNGRVRRHCTAVWREPAEIGVRFLEPHPVDDHPTEQPSARPN